MIGTSPTLIIDDFVPHQDAQKIGLRLAVDGYADDPLRLTKSIEFQDELKRRAVDGWNAILGWAARQNVRQKYDMLGEVRSRPLVTLVIWVGRCLARLKIEECDYADHLFHIATDRPPGFQLQFNPE